MAQTTKKTSPKDTQSAEQPDASASAQPAEENSLESWLHGEILARLGPISGQALITASHAHGDRRLDWMAECLEMQNQADLAEAYRQRKNGAHKDNAPGSKQEEHA